MTSRAPHAAAIAAGAALIACPPLAFLVKLLAFPGWMLVVVIWGSPILLLGYALQIVIAVNALLRARGAFRVRGAGWRGVIAAWVSSIGILAASFFLIDGGDDGRWGSAFTELTGTSNTTQGSDVSTALFLFGAVLWVGGWLWLIVEWVVQLLQVRASRRAAATSGDPSNYPGAVAATPPVPEDSGPIPPVV